MITAEGSEHRHVELMDPPTMLGAVRRTWKVEAVGQTWILVCRLRYIYCLLLIERYQFSSHVSSTIE